MWLLLKLTRTGISCPHVSGKLMRFAQKCILQLFFRPRLVLNFPPNFRLVFICTKLKEESEQVSITQNRLRILRSDLSASQGDFPRDIPMQETESDYAELQNKCIQEKVKSAKLSSMCELALKKLYQHCLRITLHNCFTGWQADIWVSVNISK